MRQIQRTLEVDGIVSVYWIDNYAPDGNSLYVRQMIQLMSDAGDHGDAQGYCNCVDIFPSDCYSTGFKWSTLKEEIEREKNGQGQVREDCLSMR